MIDDGGAADNQDELAESILEASVIRRAGQSRQRDLYALGPFAKKVSFLSQQYRALNLVWALRRENRIEPGHNIAIIGAGLAGVTAAAGLKAVGCTVRIYERGKGILPKQRDAAHRIAHPSVNWWPRKKLSPTTHLPFFDWHADECRNIVHLIDAQWDVLFSEEELIDNVEVLRIEDAFEQGVTVETDDRHHNAPYHAAIITIGFGQERSLEGFKIRSYWESDDIEQIRNNNSKKEFLVTGCGDGGLIDALRLAHFNFKQGRLTLSTAAALSGTPVAEQIQNAEQAARAPELMKKAYSEAAAALIDDAQYTQLLTKLDESLARSEARVRLVSRTADHPFAGAAAPVHKLLVAHAWRRSAIKFSMGEVIRRPGEIAIGEDCFSEDVEVVVRHGATPEFKQLLTPSEIESLERRQRGITEIHAVPHWRTADFETPGLPIDPRTRTEQRLARAKSAIRFFDPDAELRQETGVPGYDLVCLGGRPDWAPDDLYGDPLRSSPMPEARKLG
jgi:hypothetical protein